MPLAEVYRLAKGKLESDEQKTASCATHHSPIDAGPAFRPRVSSVTKHDLCCDLIQNQSSSLVSSPSMKKQKQETAKHLLNFTYFSRPVAIVRASLESVGAKGIVSPSSIEKKRVKSTESAGNSGNPIESKLMIPSSSRQEIEMGANSQPVRVPATDELRLSTAKLFEERNVLVSSCAAFQEDDFQTDESEDLPWGCRETRSVVANGERANEPAVASSVCSGNNMESACDAKHNLKRKRSEDDDSEYYLSEEYEEDTEGINTATPALGGSGCKRNRDPKVHNSSERRRRERINERMRTLQELIPNCNKVDKVSMLDEAIEYLKTLQFQLQMMSMGGRLWMPPLMFPAAMQLMQAPHMPCFSTMTPGMNALGAQLPGSPTSGASNQQMMAGYNSSMLGTHGQRSPVLMPYLGSVSYSTINPTMPANASRPGGLIGDVDCAHTWRPKESRQK